jgi:thiosulfate dehydrogenase
MEDFEKLRKNVRSLIYLVILLTVAAVLLIVYYMNGGGKKTQLDVVPTAVDSSQFKSVSLDNATDLWTPPSEDVLQKLEKENVAQINYGKDLISNTSKYFGPMGSIAPITNGMNCQNCHLDAGTKPYGNNYGAVFSTYPKYRARSGAVEDIYKRVADCFERSLNGTAPIKGSKEMEAIVAYINFTGSNVEKGKKAKGSGIYELKFLDRPADPTKGKIVYLAKCVSCHKEDGSGIKAEDKITYQYPPLWGANAYNTGAGLYRISRFAGYIKANMPFGASYKAPQLSDEEAWDIAAYVNSMPHPSKDISKDWPKVEEKTFDHPFGPFADGFSEEQHKFGPFAAIKKMQKTVK